MQKILAFLAKVAVFVQGKKTYFVCAAAIVGAWYQYFIGNDPMVQDAINTTETALMAAFIRHGVTTEAAKN